MFGATALAAGVTALPAQAGFGSLLTLLLVVGGVLVAVALGLYGLDAAVSWLFSSGSSGGRGEPDRDWDRLTDHPEIASTGRYGDGSPEVETTVDGRRVVARLETAPGGTDRYAVLETAMLSVRAGTGFELAVGDGGRVQFVDRGPAAPSLPEAVRRDLETLATFGGLTVDDRTGVVEHRFPDPEAVADGDRLRRQARALVAVAEAVEAHAESAAESERATTEGDRDRDREYETGSERA